MDQFEEIFDIWMKWKKKKEIYSWIKFKKEHLSWPFLTVLLCRVSTGHLDIILCGRGIINILILVENINIDKAIFENISCSSKINIHSC